MSQTYLDKLLWDQETEFSRIARKVQKLAQGDDRYRPMLNAIKSFLRNTWDPFFGDWNSGKQSGVIQFAHIYDEASKAGIPETSFLANRQTKSSGDSMNPKFLAQCKFQIAREDDGTHYLRGSICIGDKCYSKEIPLDPIIEQIREMVSQYHAEVLHGDDRIAGSLGDLYKSASSIAKRVASSKVAKTLYNEAKDEALGKIPGGQAAYKLAVKAHDAIVAARSGDPTAKAKLTRLAELASEGDPKAIQVLDMAKSINSKLKEKDTSVGWHLRNPFKSHPKKPTPPPRGRQTAKSTYATHAATNGRPVDATTSDDGDDGDDDGNDDAPDRGDDGGVSVSGWFYNRGYRTPSQYLVEIQKSPGVGFSFRELYSLGNGNQPTSKESLLLQASPQLSKLYDKAKQLGHDHPKALSLAKTAYDKIRALA